jgi:predicted Rossmann fold flavoprotein
METRFDVAVIGGGPAGMMAAGRAAEMGANVILLEKNPELGRKLLITGGGRCNILNAEYDTHRLVDKYGKKGRSLFSCFSQCDVTATVAFFEALGVRIKVEAEQRAFPTTERALDVQRAMIRYITENKVTVRLNAVVKGIEQADGHITKILLDDGELLANRVILATGGKSHPETGSTGEGFQWLKELGHTIIEPDPALVPIVLKEKWISDLAGISLRDVKLIVMQNGVRHDARIGKMLFTHTGLSGPLVLNMSKNIGALLKNGNVTLALDLFPTMDTGAVDRMLLEHFEQKKNKMIKNNVGDLVQPRLAQILLLLTGIDTETPLYRLTRADRIAFAKILKGLPMTVKELMGAEKAIVTGGGESLNEVEFKTMRSKLFDNLYLAGDILDFDRPSGGFSLQICWTTGFVAGTGAATSL